MPYASRSSVRNPRILHLLAQEMKEQIAGFDPNGQGRRVLAFAYKDLETCLGAKWEVGGIQLHIKLMKASEHNPEEVKAFLKIWIGRWLGKWRERVRIFQKIPEHSKRRLRSVRKAKKIYRRMGRSAWRELKRLVVRKLVNQGEVCMPKIIAENLIIEEITHQLSRTGGKPSFEAMWLNQTKILQGLLSKIKTLADRKTPLIYLKIRHDIWNT